MDNKLVYQYLPISSFKKMIKKKTIRLSNIRNSNDLTEIVLGADIFKKVIFEEINKIKKISKKDKDKFIRQFNKTTKHIDYFNLIKQHGQFVSCFSKYEDKLSQWIGYSREKDNGCEGFGVSVGFSIQELEKLALEEYNIKGLQAFTFGKVKYSSKHQKSLFRNCSKEICAKFIKHYFNNTINNSFWKECRLLYENELTKFTPYVKNKFFNEEGEYRLCHWNSFTCSIKTNIFKTDIILSNKDFIKNKKKNNLKSKDMYFYLYLNKNINKFIKKVVVGPGCMLSVEEVKKILQENGVTCPVVVSKGYKVYVESNNHF